MYPSVSIVVNTLNRAKELQRTLESFCWLKYPGDLEVIVVNGPSKDNTESVIETWLPKIRIGRCKVANLSTSRNIGICLAQGQIVAFIDDDAVPEPEWLTQLVEPYEDSTVGASGGFVYDHTGYAFQYKYGIVDRFGHADLSPSAASPNLNFPKSYRFPHLLGCNSSFRRSALLEVGGFDEEYEYFLDETDLCLRIVDAGYVIAQLAGAYVHHKFAASNIRGANRVATNRYPVLKNKLYFMLKHAREFHSLERVLEEHEGYVQHHRNDVAWAVGEKMLSMNDGEKFENDAKLAFEVGLKRGLEGVAQGAMITAQKRVDFTGKFTTFPPIEWDEAKVILLISRDYPPGHNGGIGAFVKDLATALAALGHTVHVLAQSPDHNRVDFENGVWVHRLVVSDIDLPEEALDRRVPRNIWNWSATALAEAKRIETHRKIDVVEATIWDCEGIAFLLDGQWPLVTSLATTLHFYLEFNQKRKHDESFMNSFGRPMLALELEMMAKADGVRANSHAIIREIERAYKFTFDSEITKVIPNGVSHCASLEPKDNAEQIEILFVGRLETRKGIDILLDAVERVVSATPEVLFRIVGEDCQPEGAVETTKQRFMRENAGRKCLERTVFVGRIADEGLRRAYADCDIFVAPSRFESFGLIFVEAMREGKPVIGCATGGVVEVIEDGVNGILIPPENPDALAEAILRLVRDKSLRLRMGRGARRLFEERFTVSRSARDSHLLFDAAKRHHKDHRG